MDVEGLMNAKLAQAGALRGPYPTPEWDPYIPEIYARTFTIEKRKQVNPWIAKDDPAGWVEVIARFALDEDGNKIFKHRADAAFLRSHERDQVVIRIATWIMQVEELDEAAQVGALEKNSEATDSGKPSSSSPRYSAARLRSSSSG